MTAEPEKNLTDAFSAATETQNLLTSVKELIQKLQNMENSASPVLQLAITSSLTVLETVCLKTVENQVRQDKKIAELEARLGKLDKPVPPSVISTYKEGEPPKA